MTHKGRGKTVAEPGVLFLIDALGALRDLVTTLIESKDGDALQAAIVTLTETPEVDGCAVLLRDEAALGGPGSVGAPVFQEGMDESLLELTRALAREVLAGGPLRHDPDLSALELGLGGSLMLVQMRLWGETIGALAIWNHRPFAFRHWHANLFRLVCDVLALSIGVRSESGAAAGQPLKQDAETAGAEDRAGEPPAETLDAMTGLLSRTAFETMLSAGAGRRPERAGSVFLFYVDIDRYRLIRQFGGDETAERVVRILGEAVQALVGVKVPLGRMGHDELALLIELPGVQGAKLLAQRLVASVDALRMSHGGQVVDISVSVGIAPLGEPWSRRGDALRQAQTACLAAKRHGGGTYQVYSDAIGLKMHSQGDAVLLNQLTCALKEDSLVLFAQAIVPARRGDAPASGAEMFEILVRMTDKRGSILSAAAFLPLAERYGLSVKLDRWVIREAFRQLSAAAEGPARTAIFAINLSGHSIDDPRLLDFIVGQFRTTGLVPGRICFEITETAAISDIDAAQNFIRVLKDIGCKFALDDFGSGHSSFLYLRDLEVDYLKIEGHLVRDIGHDEVSQAFVRAINDIGKIMGKLTIAEYVETPEIMTAVREIGIDLAQGYAIGRPGPLSQLVGN